MNCLFCNKKYNRCLHHAYACKQKPIDNKKEIKFLYLKHLFPFISKEWLIQKYNTELMSLPDLKSNFNIDFKYTIFLLDYFGLHKRSISEGQKLSGNPKYKKTCLKKYGKENALSKGTLIYEKRNSTIQKKYGVKNVFQLEAVKEKINISMLQKYGKLRVCNPQKMSEVQQAFSIEKIQNKVKKWKNTINNWTEEEKLLHFNKKSIVKKRWWESLSDDQKNEFVLKITNSHSNVLFTSKIEQRVCNIIDKWQIEYKKWKPIKGFLYDICLADSLILEINGDYWHANPIKYKAKDAISYPNRNVKIAEDIWKRDAIKKSVAENKGYKVLYIWESDINNKSEEQLEEYIYNIILNA